MSILYYIAKRLATLIPVLLGITILAFLLGTRMPGDPVDSILNPDGDQIYTQEQYDILKKRLGLDDPKPLQYIKWLRNMLSGEMGQSFFTNKSIRHQLALRLPVTLRLASLSMVLSVLFGIGFGLLMAVYKDTLLDHLLSAFATLALCVPSFWIAILLIVVFAEKWKILPTSGVEGFSSYILPALTLSLGTIGGTARLMRTSMLHEMSKQYLLVASAKGMLRRVAAFKHAFVNALLPIVTYLGTHFAGILGGSSVVEVIFSLPGVGSYAIGAVRGNDALIVQSYVLLSGLIYVLMNMMIDLVYLLLSPKIRAGEKVG